MGRVLVTHRLPEGGTDPLTAAGHEIVDGFGDAACTSSELAALAPGFDAIVCLLTDPIDEEVLRSGASGRLRAVGNVAVGYNNIDVVAADGFGISVCNTPGVLDETTADLAFLLVLAASRLATEAEGDLRAQDAGKAGGSTSISVATSMVRCSGSSGSAGSRPVVAHRATGFGMEVLHHSRRPTGEEGYISDLDGAHEVVGHREHPRPSFC